MCPLIALPFYTRPRALKWLQLSPTETEKIEQICLGSEVGRSMMKSNPSVEFPPI
jgi:hypothetical protein